LHVCKQQQRTDVNILYEVLHEKVNPSIACINYEKASESTIHPRLLKDLQTQKIPVTLPLNK